jgi:hypothetical protein
MTLSVGYLIYSGTMPLLKMCVLTIYGSGINSHTHLAMERLSSGSSSQSGDSSRLPLLGERPRFP